MSFEWVYFYNKKRIEIKVFLNAYIGLKKVYINGKKILNFIDLKSDNIKFEFDKQEYNVNIIQDGYDYIGYLITPRNEKIECKNNTKAQQKVPFWTFIFIAADMMIPIISVEALRPWIIGLSFSFVTLKIACIKLYGIKSKMLFSFVCSLLAWIFYYWFYMQTKPMGFPGGLLY